MELTEELAEDEGFKIDHEGFKAAMKEQQERARASVVKGGSMGMQSETLSSITEESVFSYTEEVLDSTLSVIIADNERTEAVSEVSRIYRKGKRTRMTRDERFEACFLKYKKSGHALCDRRDGRLSGSTGDLSAGIRAVLRIHRSGFT